MIQGNLENINSSVRQIKGKVGLIEGSTTTNSGEIIRADYVAPYTTISAQVKSKNLFDCANAKTIAANATAITSKTENKIIVSNSNVNKYQYVSLILPDTLENKTITLSGNWVASGSNNGCLRIEWVKDDSSTVGSTIAMLTTSGNSVSATVRTKPEGATKLALFIYSNLNGIAAIGDTVEYSNIQIELGTTATSYAPYVDWNATKPKKNLIQTFAAYSNVSVENGVITQTVADDRAQTLLKCQAYYNTTYIRLFANQTLILGVNSCQFQKTDDFNYIVFGLNGKSRDTTIKIDISHLPNGAYTISGNFTNITEGSVSWTDMMIEPGTVATEYEPYQLVPANEIKAYGKNLIPYPYIETTLTRDGITFADKGDGTITLNGTCTATTRTIFYLQKAYDKGIYLENGVDYFLSGAPKGSSYSTYWLEGATPTNWPQDKGSGVKITGTGEKHIFYIVVKAGVVLDNVIFKPQLEVGITATEYEPYKEPTIYPLTAPTELEITPYCHSTTLIASPGVIMDTTFENVNPKVEYTHEDALQSITIERTPDETKFFGYGISQKLNVKLRDVKREINTTTANGFKVYFAAGDDEYINNFPSFYVSETHRDENTNALSITAYDLLYTTTKHQISEIGLTSYTIKEMMEAIASKMGLELDLRGDDRNLKYSTFYENGANLEGSETFRDVLDDIAEATQTIYYISGERLVFRGFDRQGGPVLEIGKQDYITLKNNENRRLVNITHATELGDNVSASINLSGSTQYIRDNAFWEMREDIDDLVNKALNRVAALTIGQFDMTWRGNYLLEPVDKIFIITKDNNRLMTYYLNSTLEYNGALSETLSWNYTNNDEETASNPTTLGEALKQTYAKVDKVNKDIELVVSDVSEQEQQIAGININLQGITTYYEEEINGIKQSASTYLTKDEYNVSIQDGVEGQNYKFNKDGLEFTATTPDTHKEVKTVINNEGMTVYADNSEKLTASDEGVIAVDLTAKTYLIIGNNSRFEDYGNRTACFWIGG